MQGQKTEHAAVYGARVAGRTPDAETGSSDPVLRLTEDLRLCLPLQPVARHLEVVLSGLALHSARITLHEHVAPVPAAQVLPLLLAQPTAVDLGSPGRKPPAPAKPCPPPLAATTQPITSDVASALEPPFPRPCRSPPA